MVQLTMPPASILQRFCIMAAAISSLAMHIIFMPSLHFSIFMVQRGIIIMFIAPAALVIGMLMLAPIPDIPIMFLSIVIVPFMFAPRIETIILFWFVTLCLPFAGMLTGQKHKQINKNFNVKTFVSVYILYTYNYTNPIGW